MRLSAADITITSGTSVVLATGAAAGDILDVVAYGTFNVAAVNGSAINAGTINDARLPTTMATKTLTDATITAVSPAIVKGDGSSTDGAIRLNCSQNSHYTELKSSAHGNYAGNISFTLPANTGSNGQVLATNGSGVLSFIDATETKPTVANVSQTIAPVSYTHLTLPTKA